jgi:hypothetical protein
MGTAAAHSLGITPGFVVGMVVFGLAMAVLVVLTVRWAVRQDRTGRKASAARRRAGTDDGGPGDPAAVPPGGLGGNGAR